jgi:putative membrane protein insertion efficiency factor
MASNGLPFERFFGSCSGNTFEASSRSSAGTSFGKSGGASSGASLGSSLASRMLLVSFRAYQIFFSPFLGGACKFYPSCSNYAYQAVERHGARRGLVLALKRLGRCRPFTKGGVDLVPDADESPVFPRERNLFSPAQCHAASFVARTEKEPKQ